MQLQEQGRVDEASSSSNSNPIINPCAICHGLITKDAYLDRCFHKFCYDCIMYWTKVVIEKSSSSSSQPSTVTCPICRTNYFSIIYGLHGSTFQRHFINGNNTNSAFLSEAHKYRLQCYGTDPGLLRETFKVERYWKLRKYLQPNNQLEIWLRRELQSLTQEEDVEVIMHNILGVIQFFVRRQRPNSTTHAPQLKREDFKASVADAANPFLTAGTEADAAKPFLTERFVDELELFLASELNVEAYDNAYKRCLGWKNPEETSECTEPTISEHDPVCPYTFDDSDDDD